ncbi:MAG: PadR family transcriptional regulator [Limisphaerales bacterium]
MSDFFENWTVQVRKGMLELCILDALAERERYGYELVKLLTEIPGLVVSEGTLYPILSRLRQQQLVSTRLEESPEGPARKYYALTAEGRKVMGLMHDYLDTLNTGAARLRRKGGKS